MEIYNRIIESLSVRFHKTNTLQALESFSIENYCEIENTFIYVQRGCLYYGKEKHPVQEKEVLFIPGGKGLPLAFGDSTPKYIYGSDYHERYNEHISYNLKSKEEWDTFICMQFEAKVFNAISLFFSLDLPPFVVKKNDKILQILKDISEEARANEIGKENMLVCKSKELIMQFLRYIIRNKLFVQQIITNSNHLRDERLTTIFHYINENLGSDLSNRSLAFVANISADYIGQYFKALTGLSPQNYIEFQRMQRAVALLRGTDNSIQNVGRDVGYQDTSYFCRRFKMMFGISAGHMRRRENVHTTVI